MELEVKTWSSMDAPFPKEMMIKDPDFPGEDVFEVGGDDFPCDHQLAVWLPPDPTDVEFELVMIIGPANEDEFERFTTYIRTKKAFLAADELYIGEKDIIIDSYDWEKVKNGLVAKITRCSSETWEESKKELQKLFYFDGDGVWI